MNAEDSRRPSFALTRTNGSSNSVIKIVARTIGESDDTLGDMPLFKRILGFLSGAAPLLEPAELGVSATDLESSQAFRRLAARPTGLAKQLLKGEGDYVRINGVDRWIGGVHLHGRTIPWRRDRQTGRLVSV